MRHLIIASFFILTLALSFSEAKESVKKIFFIDGERVALHLLPFADTKLDIISGKANRFSMPAAEKEEKTSIQLDISSRLFSARISGYSCLVFSGPRTGKITGIKVTDWGTPDNPAIDIDRDIVLELEGQADSLCIRLNPFARAVVHAGKLRVKNTVTVVNGGEGRLTLTGIPPEKIRHRSWNPEVPTAVSYEGWDDEPAKASPEADISSPAPTQQGYVLP